MALEALANILTALESGSSDLAASTSDDESARLLVDLINLLIKEAISLSQGVAVVSSHEQRRIATTRALEDYRRLEEHLAATRRVLLQPEALEEIIALDTEQAALATLPAFSKSVAFAVQELMHLMQIHAKSRVQADVDNGFTFSTGSSVVNKFRFAPKNGQ